MASEIKWESPNKSLNIFFPVHIEISKEKLKNYLYGISSENTFIVIHVSCKYIDKFKIKNNDRNKSNWKYFRIIGEIVIAKNFEELQHTKFTECNNDNNINYIYLSYYKNKPIFIKKSGNEENINILFMLYNVKKYIYNPSPDHVNSLVEEAYNRKKLYIKENKSKDINAKRKGRSNFEKYTDNEIIERDKYNVDDESINKNYNNGSSNDNSDNSNNSNNNNDNISNNNSNNNNNDNNNSNSNNRNKNNDNSNNNNNHHNVNAERNIELNTENREKKDCKNILNGNILNSNRNYKKEGIHFDDLSTSGNLDNFKNEEDFICFNFLENKIMQSLDLKQIITLINKKCIYAHNIENYKIDDNNSNKRDFYRIKKKKYIVSFIVYIILFLIYFISLISRYLYYIFFISNILSKFIITKNKINAFYWIKEKLLFHSEWHSIIDNLIKNKKNPSEYHKYKQILLIRFFNLIIDFLLGIFVYLLLSYNIVNFYFLSEKFKIFYDSRTLTSILGTLLQNPLGLKLNNNFTSFIGSVIVSILDKWDYLKISISIRMHYVVEYFRFSSLLGVSFFLSSLIDYLSFITMHVSLIFFFLKKICSTFHSNIYSLYLLFNGKKWNILKLRVDTNYYTKEEVIFGTILFTILIFLYPTAFVLVLVFGIIYFTINRIIYSLFLLKEIILYSPFYIFFVTSNFNKYISKGIKFSELQHMEYEELKNFPKAYYLVLENNKFLFCDKIKLFINLFFNFDKYK